MITLTQTFGYHVTRHADLESIFKHGLVPAIGERSAQLTANGQPVEREPRVYFFPSLEDCETAMMQWLADYFSEDEPLCLLLVDLTGHDLEQDCAFELSTRKPVPPESIQLLNEMI